MIVCVCRRVSDRDITRAAASGCASFDELQARLGVATGCGACRDCAQGTFDRARSALDAERSLPRGGYAAPACALQQA